MINGITPLTKPQTEIEMNFKKQVLILIFVTSTLSPINAQTWSKSFSAGGYDVNKKFLGGSEVLQLVKHKGLLFASIGYWEDENNIWYGGSNSNIGWGQINRLDNPFGDWQEDFFLAANYLRPEILKQIIFTKDQFGNSLSAPDTVLICAGYSPNYITRQVKVKSFVRNDMNGKWGESQIFQGGFPDGENYSIRDIEIYIDQETGLEYVFATVGVQGIFKGKYNPSNPGKIDWITTAEFGPLSIRPLGIEVANGGLYFSSGSRLYRRIDGVLPNYVTDHDFSDLGDKINSAVGGIRGLTTIDNPSDNNEALLMMWCPNGQSKGVIYRLEPDGVDGFNRINETQLSSLIGNYLTGSNISYVLGAYNEFYKYIDPISNNTNHIVGFEANVSGGGHPTWNSYYKGAMFAKRDLNGQYSIEEINGTITENDAALVASRCYVSSPFQNEKAIYFGGFDPNRYVSTNKAWVFKKDFNLISVQELTNDEPDFMLFPNPVNNVLYIKSKDLIGYEFLILNLLGNLVMTGNFKEQYETINVSHLPPNIYFIKASNKIMKFIKI